MNKIKTKRWNILLILVLSLITAACSTMSARDCRNANWLTLGLEDGESGKNKIHSRQKQCGKHGIPLDGAAYERGYKQGLQFYCEDEKAYLAGKSAATFRYHNCPEANGKVAGFHFYKGLSEHYQRRALEKERQNLDVTRAYLQLKQSLLQDPKLLTNNPQLQQKLKRMDDALK
jgi:hypothetical protein